MITRLKRASAAAGALRKGLTVLLTVLLCCLLVGCGAKGKTVHCDHCGKALDVPDNSNVEESWIVYCDECQAELGLDHLIE